jgi:hypothetical protein
MPSTGTPNISEAVMAWMSSPSGRPLQLGDVADMGQQAQLDLAVVGADQHMAGLGDEGLADLAAFLGADRDVLQVGIVRGQPAGGGRGQGVGGVHPAGAGLIAGPGVGIGALQLGQLAPVQQRARQLVALAARSSSTPASVPQAPWRSSCRRAGFSSPNSTSPICLGLPRLNGRPTSGGPRSPARPCAWRSRWRHGAAGPGRPGRPRTPWRQHGGRGRSRVS